MDVLALVLKQLAALGIPGAHDIARLCRPRVLGDINGYAQNRRTIN